MINIRPVSDLRNKYPEIEELVLKEDEAVYLTKNGYGSMVVMSLEKYSKLMNNAECNECVEDVLNEANKDTADANIEKILDEMDAEIANSNTKFYTHEEIFSKIRRRINGE